MPDISDLIKKWWKPIILLVVLALTTTFLFTFLSPKKYLAVATAVPASSFASDRSRIFNDNIQALYSSLGTPDDLDLIVGTADLDTVYLAVLDELKLQDHYKVSETGDAQRMKIASLLKKNTKVMKSGYGELKIKFWDKDRGLSARIANTIMEKLRSIHQDLQSESNRLTLETLKNTYTRLTAKRDSVNNIQLNEYEKLVNEYEMLVAAKPPVLITVEPARTPEWPDKPKLGRNLIAVGAITFIFSILLALVLEKRQASKQ